MIETIKLSDLICGGPLNQKDAKAFTPTLVSKLKEAIKNKEKLQIDFSHSYGNNDFIQESFGRLKDYGFTQEEVLDTLVFITDKFTDDMQDITEFYIKRSYNNIKE